MFLFDRVDPDDVCRGSRHPRGNTAWPLVGILAQRAKDRPNRIGLTTCGVLRVEGLRIEVSGLDAIDGTPVLDIKPAMAGFKTRGEAREPAWATELMARYWLEVSDRSSSPSWFQDFLPSVRGLATNVTQ